MDYLVFKGRIDDLKTILPSEGDIYLVEDNKYMLYSNGKWEELGSTYEINKNYYI